MVTKKDCEMARLALAHEILSVSGLLTRTVTVAQDTPTPADLGLPKKQEVLDAVKKLIKMLETFADNYKESMKLYFGVDTDLLKKGMVETLRKWWQDNK